MIEILESADIVLDGSNNVLRASPGAMASDTPQSPAVADDRASVSVSKATSRLEREKVT